MVRLETKSILTEGEPGTWIYIPVWLDQKLEREDNAVQRRVNLHSSMVRLETTYRIDSLFFSKIFTFQYGQIRNFPKLIAP